MPFNQVLNGFTRSHLRGGATATSGQTSPFFPASPEAQSISDLFIIVLVFMAIILAIVTGLVFYVSWRYRAPGVVVGAGGTAPAVEPPQVFGHRQLEIIWTTIPFLILVVITGFMVRTMWAVDVPTDLKQKADLEIVGHQWWWEARYANGVVVANEIHIPAGRRLLAEVQSFDVIHDFWVPQLARKMDAIPGQPNRVWLQASQPGTYLGFCAEYCGTQHAWMQIRVVAHTEAEYAAWEKQQQAPAAAATDALAARGEKLFRDRTCISCHAVSPMATPPRTAPDLTHFATRATLGAGVLPNTRENLRTWLLQPEVVKPGTLMPNFRLRPDEADALVAYLETLK